MILRRFIQHIKDQNWFTVGLDLLVLIMGIFLGLQAQGWYEDSKDRNDEAEFKVRLKEDVVYVNQASSRVLSRRLETFDNLKKAVQSLRSNDKNSTLSQAECDAIGNSDILNIVIAELPSITELQSSGRLGIITDDKLRRAAVVLQQRIITLKEIIQQFSSLSVQILIEYPEMISVSSIYNEQMNEFNLSTQCDHVAMRESVSFMNAISTNLDIFDAYLRDGIYPWREAFELLTLMTANKEQ